jgi:hypothetical protein
LLLGWVNIEQYRAGVFERIKIKVPKMVYSIYPLISKLYYEVYASGMGKEIIGAYQINFALV